MANSRHPAGDCLFADIQRAAGDYVSADLRCAPASVAVRLAGGGFIAGNKKPA